MVPAVVALSVTAVRGFQDDVPGAHGGTGFVVDAKRGLILTNRHVCTCGPQRATAAFVGLLAAASSGVTCVFALKLSHSRCHIEVVRQRKRSRCRLPT